MLGVRTVDPDPPKNVRFVRPSVHIAGTVEHLADLNAMAEKILARGLDVINN